MSEEQELLRNDAWMYRLLRTPEGALILSVVAGGFALYEVRVRLTEEEAATYAQKGADFIDGMAKDVIANPRFYAERGQR